MLDLYGIEELGEKVLDLYYPHEIHEIAHAERWYKRDEITGDYNLDKGEINATLASWGADYVVSAIHGVEIICIPVGGEPDDNRPKRRKASREVKPDELGKLKRRWAASIDTAADKGEMRRYGIYSSIHPANIDQLAETMIEYQLVT